AGLDVEHATAGISAADVADALLRLGPRSVCLVLDDLHTIDVASDGFALLRDLVDRLPGNAHLLLSSRTMPALPLSRRFVAGVAEQLGREELAYDDDEIDRIYAGEVVDRLAASWPAL